MRALRWSLLVLATASSLALGAIEEPTFHLEDEDDILSAQQRGEISDETTDALLELIREGVDLNTANRDELYGLPGLSSSDVDAVLAQQGHLEGTAQLVDAGVLTERQATQLAPFLHPHEVNGRLRLISQVSTGDDLAPPAVLVARVHGPFNLTAGTLLAFTRQALSTPTYDPSRDALVTTGRGPQLNVPRAFLQWQSGHARLIAGTFTLGFGERLTLDNTRRVTPHGLYLSDDSHRSTDLTPACKWSSTEPLDGACAAGAAHFVTADPTWRGVFRGVAGSLEDVSLGAGAGLSAYAFASYQARTIYQYELYDQRTCADPHDNTDPGCAAPKIFFAGSTDARAIYSTVPALFDELSAGGHVDVRPFSALRLGVTGYGAAPMFHDLGPMQLSFQEWSRTPRGGPFGALGVDGEFRHRQWGFHFEAARSFDSAPYGGGGFGLVQRTTFSPKHHEVELSFRFYDDKFVNPNARPVSAPDEYDGQRARNELGARLRYQGRPSPAWELSGRADVWTLPFTDPHVGPAGMTNLFMLLRADFTGFTLVQPGLWVDARNRNLASSQHGRCASGTVIYTEGQPFDCSGDLYRVAARVELNPLPRRLSVIVQSWLTFSDDRKYPDRFRVDFQQWAEANWRATEWLSLRLHGRYLDQDVSDDAYLERSLWTYVEAAWLPTPGTRLALRYDLYAWLDARPSTLARAPNPEHRFMLDLKTTF